MEGFCNLVEDTWKNSPCVGSNAMKILMTKLKHLKNTIREWNKNNMTCRKNVKAKYKKDLEAVDRTLDSGQGAEKEIRYRSDIILKLQQCEEIDSLEMAQKAKIKWAVEGDENSKFFHGMLNKKRNILNIRGVMVDGVWVDEPKGVKREFFDHFSKRFCKPDECRAILSMDFPNRLQSDQRSDLEAEALGNIKFSFFNIPRGCNSSFIALIPKFPDANLVKDFRPISLIGSIYKIIAKILTNRLINVLGGIVNEVQSAFVANRQILDGPFILNELFQWCKVKKKQVLIFKVDFEKAYDSVRWDFLDEVLCKFGFGDKWRRWIQCCLHSSRGSIIINGSPTKEFQFGKGLKQGDPLSLFLFILIMESLHLSFQRVVDEGLFHGIKLHDTVNISHLFYADDAVLLANGIMGIHVNNDNFSRAAEKLGCLVLKPPFTYLGSMVGGDMHRLQSWNDMVDRVKRRLSKWKMKMLSIGGRLTLVKSVLGSMPIFHMSLFKVPSGILHTLESIRSHFFKGHDMSSKKASWVNWNKVIAPKEKGGLGVSSLYALNRGLMFKWVWRFISQGSSLWARVIKTVHGADGNIGMVRKVGVKSCWANIVNEINVLSNKGVNLMKYLRIRLGNGDSTLLWDDPWHVGGILKDRFPRVYALETFKSVTVGDKLAHPSLSHSFRRMPRGGAELSQFVEFTEMMQQVILAPMSDRWTWTLNNSGEFSIASVRKLIDDKMCTGGNQITRWIRYVPNKVNIHAWKVMTNSLATKFNISRRGIDIDSISCVNCGIGVETTSHLFFTCEMAQQVSHLINLWWDVPDMEIDSYDSWKIWVGNIRLTSKTKMMFKGDRLITWFSTRSNLLTACWLGPPYESTATRTTISFYIAEKVHQKKVQQEKLKAVKARLNFEEASQHSESGTLSRRRDLKERLEPRHTRSVSGSPKPRHGRSESPRERDPKRKTVFKRMENGVFHKLGDNEKSASTHSRDSRRRPYHGSRRDTESCYQSSRSRETEFASEKHHNKRASSRKTEALSESEGNAGGHWKSKPKRQKSSVEDDLSQPWKSIDSYDDLRKAFLENYLQQKKCIKDPVEIHNIKQRNGEFMEEFMRRYKLECRDVKGAPECMKIFEFMHEITNPELIKRLHDKIPKSVDEMMRVTTTFLRGEVAASNRERKKSFSSWK
ncbi:RNA-directed DNA polymerase, eukaryota [Tanacetum coccineum]